MSNIPIQNVYDDPEFFSGYKQLRAKDQGFNNLLEQPAIKSLLPELNNKFILDIGCGFGEFCYFLQANGASHIIGIDPSHNMIDEAIRVNPAKNITYQCCPVESASFDKNQFDLIISSLALHYVKNYADIVRKIAYWLKPEGHFIFSVEHPICTAKLNTEDKPAHDVTKFHPIYNYRDETCVTQTWFIEGIKKYHRTVSTYLNTLLENNFSICTVLEPMPTNETIAQRSEFSIHKIRPPLLIIKAKLNP